MEQGFLYEVAAAVDSEVSVITLCRCRSIAGGSTGPCMYCLSFASSESWDVLAGLQCLLLLISKLAIRSHPLWIAVRM